jgi:hypothetical protein
VIGLTYFPRLDTAHGLRRRTSWPALLERLSAPRVVASKDRIPGFSLATYRNDYRLKANVEHVYAIGLDFDELEDNDWWERLKTAFAGSAAFLHTTYSHTADAPRARAFILLSRPVTGPEYCVLWDHVAKLLDGEGLIVDRQARDPSRFWYLPASAPGSPPPLVHVCDGKVMRVADEIPIPEERPAPIPPAPIAPPTNAEERAEKYLDRCEPAISGQGGHNQTFLVAQKLVRGFCLSEDVAYRLLAGWNTRCTPPWSERDLRRKIRQAAQSGQIAYGSLLERRRAS